MKTETFRTIAIDETAHWRLPPELAGCRAFGVYIFREGEATYCCSLTPASWLEPLQNEFIRIDGEPLTDAQAEAAADLMHEGTADGHYRAFLRAPFTGLDVSEPREFEPDPDLRPDEAQRRLWDDARESFQANAPALRFAIPQT